MYRLIVIIYALFFNNLQGQKFHLQFIDSINIPTSFEDVFCTPYNSHQILIHPYSQNHAFLLDWKSNSLKRITIQPNEPAIITSFSKFSQINNVKFINLHRSKYLKFFKLWIGALQLMNYQLSEDTLFLENISKSLWIKDMYELNNKFFIFNLTYTPYILSLGYIQDQKLIKKKILHFKDLGLEKNSYNFYYFENQLIINHSYSDTYYWIDLHHDLEKLNFEFHKKFSQSHYYACESCHFGPIIAQQNFYYQIVVTFKPSFKQTILFWKDLKDPPSQKIEFGENEIFIGFYENFLFTNITRDGTVTIKKYTLE